MLFYSVSFILITALKTLYFSKCNFYGSYKCYITIEKSLNKNKFIETFNPKRNIPKDYCSKYIVNQSDNSFLRIGIEYEKEFIDMIYTQMAKLIINLKMTNLQLL